MGVATTCMGWCWEVRGGGAGVQMQEFLYNHWLISGKFCNARIWYLSLPHFNFRCCFLFPESQYSISHHCLHHLVNTALPHLLHQLNNKWKYTPMLIVRKNLSKVNSWNASDCDKISVWWIIHKNKLQNTMCFMAVTKPAFSEHISIQFHTNPWKFIHENFIFLQHNFLQVEC